MTHELGHALLQSLSLREQKEYSKALDWKLEAGQVSTSRPGDFVSSSAKEDSIEDFAENFSFFLLDKDKLKSKVPKAYDWFLKKFTPGFKLKEGCKK